MPGSVPLPFVLAVLPVLAAATVWAGITAWRIAFPERPLPLFRDPVDERLRRTAAGESVRVGIREIVEEMPRHAARVTHPYEHDPARVAARLDERVPSPWLDDLWRRRN